MKTKSCRCCQGSGTEFDHISVGAAMAKLRHKSGLSLRELGGAMKPPLGKPYLCDLEHGRRNWNKKLVEQYQKLCV